MQRLIDADALIDALMAYTWRDEDERLIDDADEKREFIKNWMPDLPTVDVLQKLWNALYAEEDKFEKRYISTPEHDNWFLVYRPWLQDGFGIAIKVLSEIFVSEPPKENEDGNHK